jgi:hypothetical protein
LCCSIDKAKGKWREGESERKKERKKRGRGTGEFNWRSEFTNQINLDVVDIT